MHPRYPRIARLAAAIALAFPGTLTAQDWSQPWADPDDRPPRVDISASIGFLAPTDWSDLVLLGTISSASGVLEQVLVRDLRVQASEDFGVAVTYWRGRYGFRVQGGFSSSSIAIGGPLTPLDPSGGGRLTSVDVDTWLYDVGGAIGFVDYTPDRWVWPYAFFGFGGITYDLAHRVTPSLFTFIERDPPSGGRPDILIVEDDSREFLLALDELEVETVFALKVGVGTDFRIPLGPSGIGVRLELADHISRSPVGLRIGELRRLGRLRADTGVEFSAVHHLRATAGLVLQFGR